MSFKPGSPFRGRSPFYISLVTHGLLAALFVSVGMRINPRLAAHSDEYQIAMLEVAGGSALAKVPLIMAPNGDRKAQKDQPETRSSVHAPLQKQHLPKASGSQAQLARPKDLGTSSAAGSGSDARDATFAFPIYSPRPPVTNRNLLPPSDRKVVIDVKLDAAGAVTAETLVTGIGSVLDQLALDAVKTWRFQPATVNAQPVASDAEVIFTFGPKYPVSGS